MSQELSEIEKKQAELAIRQQQLQEYECVREALVDEMNERFAVFNDGFILHEWRDAETGAREYLLLSEDKFKVVTRDLPPVTVPGSKADRTLSAASYWLASPRRRKFSKIVFEPTGAKPDKYNLWDGFAVKPNGEASCDLYLEHLRQNICQGNTQNYEYLIKWMADAVQNPGSKPGVSVVLRSSEKGTGKNTAIDYFGSLFGFNVHYIVLTDPKHLFGAFNAHLQNKVIVFADESFWAGNKADEGALKTLITNEYHMVEGKFKNAYMVKNFIHLLIASNNDWVVPADSHERRFFVLDVGAEHARDSAYFKAICEERDHGGREALLSFLLHLDLTGFDVRQYPETTGNARQKRLKDSLLEFLIEKLQDGKWLHDDAAWKTQVPAQLLLEAYRKWSAEAGYPKFVGGIDRFAEALGKLLPPGFPTTVRPWLGETRLRQHFNMPDWGVLRGHLEKVLGTHLDTEEPTDVQWEKSGLKRAVGELLRM